MNCLASLALKLTKQDKVFDLLKSEVGTLNETISTLEAERAVLTQQLRESEALLDDLPFAVRKKTANSSEIIPGLINTVANEVLRNNHHSVFWGDRLLTMDKATGFYENERFAKAFDEVKGSHEYDQYSGPDTIAWRLAILVWAAERALRLPGDFVECGVFKGDMSYVVAESIGFADLDKTFYLYDTFSGFSPEYSSPDDFPMNPGFIDFANKFYSEPGLYEGVVKKFADYSNVKIVQGVLPGMLAEGSPNQISYLHVDLNSPSAELGVMEVLFDRVSVGGAIVFDDYGWLEYTKQRRVHDVFMKERGYTILELPTGQGVVIK